MTLFTDTSNLFPKIRILILGSYRFEEKLRELVDYLIEKGFKDTYLAMDRIRIEEDDLNSQNKNELIFNQVIKLMNNSHYDIFYLFIDHNDSTIVELTTLLSDDTFKNKEFRLYILGPRDYDYTMVQGLISKNKIACVKHDEDIIKYQAALSFIKRNLRDLNLKEFK